MRAIDSYSVNKVQRNVAATTPQAPDPLVEQAWVKFHACHAIFEETGKWPTREHPEFGLFLDFVNEQFKRKRSSQPVNFSSHGLTPQLFKAFRDKGFDKRYVGTAGVSTSKGKGKGIVSKISELYAKGKTPSLSQINEVRTRYQAGQISVVTIERWQKQGFPGI